MYGALYKVCQQGGRRETAQARRGARLLRAELPSGPHRAARRARRLSHRLLRADRRGHAQADRRDSTIRFIASRRICCRAAACCGESSPASKRQEESARQARARAVLRSRRDRRRRARRPQSRNLLAERSDRLVLRPHPGLGARAARRRQAAAPELSGARTAIPIRRRPLSDRAQDRPQGRNVDGPHPAMDGGQSGGGQGAAAEEQILRVLPRDQSGRRRGADRRAGRFADARPLDRGRPQAARLWHAVLHLGRCCRSRASSRRRSSAG